MLKVEGQANSLEKPFSIKDLRAQKKARIPKYRYKKANSYNELEFVWDAVDDWGNSLGQSGVVYPAVTKEFVLDSSQGLNKDAIPLEGKNYHVPNNLEWQGILPITAVDAITPYYFWNSETYLPKISDYKVLYNRVPVTFGDERPKLKGASDVHYYKTRQETCIVNGEQKVWNAEYYNVIPRKEGDSRKTVAIRFKQGINNTNSMRSAWKYEILGDEGLVRITVRYLGTDETDIKDLVDEKFWANHSEKNIVRYFPIHTTWEKDYFTPLERTIRNENDELIFPFWRQRPIGFSLSSEDRGGGLSIGLGRETLCVYSIT